MIHKTHVHRQEIQIFNVLSDENNTQVKKKN